MKYGIENLKKVVDLGIEIAAIGEHLIKNGKDYQKNMIDLFGHVPALFTEIQAVVAAGDAIPAEFKDIDAVEAAELVSYVASKLTVEGEKAQKIVEASIDLATAMIVKGSKLYFAIKL